MPTRITFLFTFLGIPALLLLLAACGDKDEKAEPGPEPSPPPVAVAPGTSDADLGLAKGSVFDVAESPAFEWDRRMPGSNERLARMFDEAPPAVPHGIADFLPITPEENACLECHQVGTDEDGPALPESHLRDYRNAPDVVGDGVAGARHVCVACHAPTTNAPDLPELAPGE